MPCDVFADYGHQCSHGLQSGERRRGIAATPDDQRGQVFFRLCVRGFWKEKRNAIRMNFENMPYALTQYSANQNVGIKHQGFA